MAQRGGPNKRKDNWLDKLIVLAIQLPLYYLMWKFFFFFFLWSWLNLQGGTSRLLFLPPTIIIYVSFFPPIRIPPSSTHPNRPSIHPSASLLHPSIRIRASSYDLGGGVQPYLPQRNYHQLRPWERHYESFNKQKLHIISLSIYYIQLCITIL